MRTMLVIRKIRSKGGLWDLCAALNMRRHRLKTQYWYRLFFKKIGRNSIVRNPLVITYPRHISLGTGVFIRDGARLEVVPRPGAAAPQLRIGDNVSIEQDFHV